MLPERRSLRFSPHRKCTAAPFVFSRADRVRSPARAIARRSASQRILSGDVPIRIGNAPRPGMSQIAKIVLAHARATDEVGHYDKASVCVVLPETDGNGAWQFAQRVCDSAKRQGLMPVCVVYTYPTAWFPKPKNHSDRHNGNGSSNGHNGNGQNGNGHNGNGHNGNGHNGTGHNGHAHNAHGHGAAFPQWRAAPWCRSDECGCTRASFPPSEIPVQRLEAFLRGRCPGGSGFWI